MHELACIIITHIFYTTQIACFVFMVLEMHTYNYYCSSSFIDLFYIWSIFWHIKFYCNL